MIKTRDKLKTLNDYAVSTEPTEQKVPAVISDEKNTSFNYSDLAPKYIAGNNIHIEDSIISKKDTTYTGDNRIITVNPDTKEISATSIVTNDYSGDNDTSVHHSDNTSTHVRTFSLINTSIEKPSLPAAQKKQPTYRENYTTKFAGHSNKNIILLDPFWEVDHSKSNRLTRIYKDHIIYTEMDGTTTITREYPELQQTNQIEIHQHNLENIYFDYEFFVEHFGKEIYITKTISTDISKGCKFFITYSKNNKKLLVYIYSCGVICAGNTTQGNHELCLHDIAFPNWLNGQRGSSFNYILKPYGMTMGYTGNSIAVPFYHDKWYDANGKEAVIYKSSSADPDPTIVEHFDFYKSQDECNSGITDPRYEFYNYNGKKIYSSYYLVEERVPGMLPPVYRGFLTRPDDFIPLSYDEYFSSFKFIISGIDERRDDFDILYLVDSRF